MTCMYTLTVESYIFDYLFNKRVLNTEKDIYLNNNRL